MKLLRIFLPISILILFAVNSFAESSYPKSQKEQREEQMGSIFGGDGLVFQPGKIMNSSTRTDGMPVNKYLWIASLEAVNFMPISSTDAVGGIIVTDWYSNEKNATERFKIMIMITDNVITPSSIDVRVYKRLKKEGEWVDVKTSDELRNNIEDKILRRARDLNIDNKKKGKK